MRTSRILGEPTRATNCYHAMSRILEGRFVLEGDREKEKLREILVNQAAMSGVRVLTYAIMSNHFILPLRGTLCSQAAHLRTAIAVGQSRAPGGGSSREEPGATR